VAARLKRLSPEQVDQVFDQDDEEAMRAFAQSLDGRINMVSCHCKETELELAELRLSVKGRSQLGELAAVNQASTAGHMLT
jgi:hypothetical protein